MSIYSTYCKAYEVATLRSQPGWDELATPELIELSGDTVVFIHDDLSLTKGVYPGEDVLLDGVRPEWKGFCQETLGFAVPADLG